MKKTICALGVGVGVGLISAATPAMAQSSWQKVPGCAKAVAGSDFVLGCTGTAAGWNIYAWSPTAATYVQQPGQGYALAVEVEPTNGREMLLFVVDQNHKVRFNLPGTTAFPYFSNTGAPGGVNCENNAPICARGAGYEGVPVLAALGSAPAYIDCDTAGTIREWDPQASCFRANGHATQIAGQIRALPNNATDWDLWALYQGVVYYQPIASRFGVWVATSAPGVVVSLSASLLIPRDGFPRYWDWQNMTWVTYADAGPIFGSRQITLGRYLGFTVLLNDSAGSIYHAVTGPK